MTKRCKVLIQVFQQEKGTVHRGFFLETYEEKLVAVNVEHTVED